MSSKQNFGSTPPPDIINPRQKRELEIQSTSKSTFQLSISNITETVFVLNRAINICTAIKTSTSSIVFEGRQTNNMELFSRSIIPQAFRDA